MFPRGAGNLEEVPQSYVVRCIVKDRDDESDASGTTGTHPPAFSSLFVKALDLMALEDIG